MTEYQVTAQCQETEKEFILTVEKNGDKLVVVDGKTVSKDAQTSERSDDLKSIHGRLDISSTYTGCPYCGNTGFFNCGKQLLPDTGDSTFGDLLKWADKKLTGCGSLLCHDGSQTGYCVECNMPRVLLGGDIEEVVGATGDQEGESREPDGVMLDRNTAKLRKDE